MNILIVSAHPAQVHNFRELREELIRGGHKVFWATTSKDIATKLLRIYGIDYKLIKKAPKGFLGRLLFIIKNLFILIPYIVKNKIDLIIDRCEPFTTLSGWIIRKQHISLSDTEHAAKICSPLFKMCNVSLTPNCFYEKVANQLYFPGNIELFYLHPNRYTPQEPWDLLNIPQGTKYALVRFVKWDAYHDVNLIGGFSLEKKIELVNRIAKHCKVFISSEEVLPDELQQYQIKIPLERMHDVLAGASLVVGESATMASESVVLGTPAVYVDEIGRGYTDEEAREGLLHMFRPVDDASKVINDKEWIEGGVEESIAKAEEIVSEGFDINAWNEKHKKWLSTKIDCTAFLTWFIENYPESAKLTKEGSEEFWERFR